MKQYLASTGIIASLIYVIFMVVLAFQNHGFFDHDLKLDALGNYLAGVFGPLAILWVMLSFFQQRIELEQNTHALRLQAEELKNSVDQQKVIVSLSRAQLDMQASNAQLEHDRMAASLEPKFSMKSTGANSQGNGILNFQYKLTNGGHSITCLIVSFDSNEVLSDSFLGTGQSANFSLPFSETGPLGGQISVQYLNGLEESKYKRFHLEIGSSNRGGWVSTITPPNGELVS